MNTLPFYMYILVAILQQSCLSTSTKERETTSNNYIAISEVIMDTTTNASNQYQTAFYPILDYSHYNGQYTMLRVYGWKKVTLTYTGEKYLNYYTVVPKQESQLVYKKNRASNTGVRCSLGNESDLFSELHNRDSCKIKVDLLIERAYLMKNYDSISFTMQFWNHAGNDTIVNFGFPLWNVKIR